MSVTPPPEDDPFDDLVLDEDFVSGGPREAAAEERIAKAQRIARSNDRLRAEGEIADGSGKPRYSRLRKSTPWILIGVIVSVAIVVIVLVVR
jgi:hypothetical protein